MKFQSEILPGFCKTSVFFISLPMMDVNNYNLSPLDVLSSLKFAPTTDCVSVKLTIFTVRKQ